MPKQHRAPLPAWSGVRDTVAAMPNYRSPGTAVDFDAATGPRLLHLNESALPPSPKAIAAARDAAAILNRYPDPMASKLCAALEQRTGIEAARIVVGCGSEEILRGLIDLGARAGDEVVMPAPSFPLYAVETRLRDAVPVRAALDPLGANDPATLLARITPRTRVLVACTPNPPTGEMMGANALATLLDKVPDDVLLVLDEAYYEYARHAGGPDALSLLARRAGPWAVVRTFSKAYGLAGARVGYALCGSLAVAEALRNTTLSYGVTDPAQAAALAALEDEPYLTALLDNVAAERRRLEAGLKAMGLHTFPTVTNFVSVRLHSDARAATDALRQRGILVRDWRDPEHLKEIRITVGLPEDTDRVLSALKQIAAASANT